MSCPADPRFKKTLEQTDGNLGAQLHKLEEAGYITADKQFEQRRPVTWYTLTEQGNVAVQKHVTAMQQLLDHSDLTL